MIETTDLAVLAVVISPFVGSFLGVLIKRLPAGDAVVLGRSRCAACHHVLGPLDLVPLVSWVVLRRRCRHCGVRLTWFHPAVELAAMAVALWSLAAVPAWLVLPSALLGWMLIVLAVIDWEHMLLPDVLTILLIAAGLLGATVASGSAPVDQLAGAIIGGGFFAAITVFYGRVMKREGLGLGDAKLFAGAGAWVGWQGLASVLVIGGATGLAVTVALAAARRQDGAVALRSEVPFGPYLALATWLTWLHGPLGFG